MPKPHFSTIKWITEEDDGKITVGVPIECILGFNYKEFSSVNFDPDLSYVIEWRTGTKEPPGGWPKYDGVVLEVATTVQALERKSVNYVYPKSPRLPPPGTKEPSLARSQSGTSGQKRASEIPKNPDTFKKRKRVSGGLNVSSSSEEDSSNKDEEEIDNSEDNENDEVPENFRTPLRARDNQEPGIPHPGPADGPGNQVPADDVIQPPHGIPATLQNVARQPPQIPYDNQRSGRLLELGDLLRENFNNFQRQLPQEENPDSVELGQKVSGVRVTITQWNAAKEMRSFTFMATNLVMALFDLDTLLISNVKGDASKIKKPEENPPRHQKLNADILEAIAGSVRREFPNSFRTSEMNRAINVKLNKLRSLARAEAVAAARRHQG